MARTYTLDEFVVKVTPAMVRDMQQAHREVVNEIALAIVTDARKELRAVIGSDQRLSARGKPGNRINPYFKEANSETKPYAIIAVRGPAQYIEHPRRGDYDIPKDRTKLRRGRKVKRLKFPSGEYATAVKGGPIVHPRAPITRAFKRGNDTARRTKDALFAKHFKLTYGD